MFQKKPFENRYGGPPSGGMGPNRFSNPGPNKYGGPGGYRGENSWNKNAGGYQTVPQHQSQNGTPQQSPPQQQMYEHQQTRFYPKNTMYQNPNQYEEFSNQMVGGAPQAFNGHNGTRFYSSKPHQGAGGMQQTQLGGPGGRYNPNNQYNGDVGPKPAGGRPPYQPKQQQYNNSYATAGTGNPYPAQLAAAAAAAAAAVGGGQTIPTAGFTTGFDPLGGVQGAMGTFTSSYQIPAAAAYYSYPAATAPPPPPQTQAPPVVPPVQQ